MAGEETPRQQGKPQQHVRRGDAGKVIQQQAYPQDAPPREATAAVAPSTLAAQATNREGTATVAGSRKRTNKGTKRSEQEQATADENDDHPQSEMPAAKAQRPEQSKGTSIPTAAGMRNAMQGITGVGEEVQQAMVAEEEHKTKKPRRQQQQPKEAKPNETSGL
jgi:hypothetical protein